jgi:hypothetical protein
MKKNYKFLIFTFLLFFAFGQNVQAQYASKKVRTKHQAYTDSLKSLDYNYTFPILGQGAYSEGFDIPYPMGIMANYFWADQGILINNFQLGFKSAYGGPSFDLRPLVDENGQELLGFGESRNVSYSANVRPDLWLFPFLNVYGIFGYGSSTTTVVIDRLGGNILKDPIVSEVTQGIRTMGVGVLVAGGVGPIWISGDFNFTWNKPELLDKATQANVMGIRVGHTFVFKKRPYRNFAIWVGAMRIKMQSETVGAIKLRDAFGQEFYDNKDSRIGEYWDWYNNEATPIQKKIADKALTPIVNEIDKRDGESIVEYGMDKQVTQMWNGLLGLQFQLNKHWQFRAEAGLIGDRKSILFSINYRFLGFRRKNN